MRPGQGAPLGAGLLTLIASVALTWPWLPQAASAHVPSAFGDSHAWVLEQLLAAGGALDRLCEAGFPVERSARAIAMAPLLMYAPLRLIAEPLVAAALVQLLALPLSAALATALVRRATDAPAPLAALLGACWALCPTLLGAFASLELSNTAAWALPAFLLALGETRRGRAWVLLPAVIAALTAFTSPYYGLALPLLGLGWAAFALRDGWRLPSVGLRLGLVALALLPARAFYDPGQGSGAGDSLFWPAQRAALAPGPLPQPAPVATLDGLLWSAPEAVGSPYEVQHVAWVGPVLVTLGLWGLLGGAGKGRRLGLSLTLGGLALSLGPALAVGDRYLSLAGGLIPGPVWLLEAAGYPTALGGLYYRYVVVLVLGLVLGVARLGARYPFAQPLLALGLLVGVADGLRRVGPGWPLAVEALPVGALAALPPGEGAILELPLPGPTDGHFGQAGLLRSLLLDRPTTALPRAFLEGHPAREPLEAAVAQASAAPLRAAGYRFVALPVELAPFSQPGLSVLRQILGDPVIEEAGLILWDLGPAVVPACWSRPG